MSSSKTKNELEIKDRGRNAHGAASTDMQKLHLNEIQQMQFSEAPKMMRAAILPPSSHTALGASANRNHLLHDDVFAQRKPSAFLTGNGEKLKEDTPLKKSGSEAFGVHSESTIWKVRHESLTCVPKYVKVARTHVFLNNTDAGIITKRISDCLRKLSIHASFNDNQAMAECESHDSIKFIIQLYRGGGNFANGVIVEIQCMHGCCMRFMECCRSILQAAKNVHKVARTKVARLPVSKMNLPQPRRLGTSCEIIEKQCTLSMKMSCICRLIFESGTDSQALGLEMLRDATDPSKIGANHATKAVKSLFDGGYMKVFNYISSLIDPKPLVDKSVEKKFRLRFLALCILSNVLLVASSVGDLPQIIQKNSWFVDSLVLTLIEDLKNSKICSNSALQAAKCLNHVVSASQDVKAKAIEIDAVRAVTIANEYGRYSHAPLEKETECCVKSLQCH